MCPSDRFFVETMCSCHGVIALMDYHNERLNRTRREVFGCDGCIDLRTVVSPDASAECLKVRVVYGCDGITDVSYAPYTPRDVRTLRLVTCNDIDYRYKSTDRSRLSALAALRGSADEVLIVRNGLLTDTSYTNIAVSIGGRWLTPRLPLLKGTRRASLLDRGLISEADISPDDISPETDIILFNGMMEKGKEAHVVNNFEF